MWQVTYSSSATPRIQLGKSFPRRTGVRSRKCVAVGPRIEHHVELNQAEWAGNSVAAGQAIGSAKELIESTAKYLLDERGVTYTKNDDVTQLINRAQESASVPRKRPQPDQTAVQVSNAFLAALHQWLLVLLNFATKYGTGHGVGRPRTGLGPRHAHLAVNAAFMCCQLMLDTMADPKAPWRKQAAAAQN